MDIITVCGALGFAFGVIGSAVNSLKRFRCVHWAWPLYLGSNVSWIAYALLTGQKLLLAQTLCFSVTSAVGIWEWIISPRLTDSRRDATPDADGTHCEAPHA